MHVVDSVVHDGRSDVLASETHGPGLLDVQVQSGLASSLTRVLLNKQTDFYIGVGRKIRLRNFKISFSFPISEI